MNINIRELTSSEHSKWFALATMAILFYLIAVQSSQLIHVLLPTNNTPTQHIEHVNAALPPLDNFHLFGQAQQSPENVSSLDSAFTLSGLFLADKPARSHVLISDEDGNQKIYHTGDQLPNGATIKKILAHKVLVKNHGKLESLSFAHDELTFEAPPSNTNSLNAIG